MCSARPSPWSTRKQEGEIPARRAVEADARVGRIKLQFAPWARADRPSGGEEVEVSPRAVTAPTRSRRSNSSDRGVLLSAPRRTFAITVLTALGLAGGRGRRWKVLRRLPWLHSCPHWRAAGSVVKRFRLSDARSARRWFIRDRRTWFQPADLHWCGAWWSECSVGPA